MFRFADEYILLFIFPLIYFFYRKYKEKDNKSLKFSSLKVLSKHGFKKTIKHKISRYILLTAVILLITAAARPQFLRRDMSLSQEGIDIVIALDISGSMDNKDFFPNRLGAAKNYLDKFIVKRPYDRFALVVYGGEAYTRLPLTLDHELMRKTLKKVTLDDISDSNTAIGMALVTAINRLKSSTAESKVIILMTDGVNNTGNIDPITAAEMASDLGMKTYILGIGKDKFYNERLMNQIALAAEGDFFQVDKAGDMETIFERIDQMEKTKFRDKNHELTDEHSFLLINIGILLILLAFILDHFVFLKLP